VIRLIGIDVDGTLVGSSKEVHPSIWQAADRARAAGIRLTLCSGRPAFGIALEYARRLDADAWHVFQNGASVVHLGNQESRSVELPAASVHALVERSRSSGEVLELYSDTSYVVEERESDFGERHAELLGVPYEPRAFESLKGTVVRAQWVVSPPQAEREMATPHPGLEVSQSESPLMQDVHFIGMTREGVNKGSAVRAVASAYGVDLKDVMYVGDANNDLSALRVVGCPVAMGNGTSAVRQAARITVGHVDDAGLAQALQWAVANGGGGA
jgi:Cof subfamily protein (haloacid dehalogenase superfamily)